MTKYKFKLSIFSSDARLRKSYLKRLRDNFARKKRFRLHITGRLLYINEHANAQSPNFSLEVYHLLKKWDSLSRPESHRFYMDAFLMMHASNAAELYYLETNYGCDENFGYEIKKLKSEDADEQFTSLPF